MSNTFDRSVDAALERVRGRRVPDRVFQAASIVGDFSVIWHITGVLVAVFIAHHLLGALWFSALLGVESLIVNQGIKRLFRRARPTETGDARTPVRKPRTSSFPSGHASAAFFAASLLIYWVGWAWAPLWITMACIVALSRAYVRIHHPSDVLGGVVVGLLLAQVVFAIGNLAR
ncbi:MAG: phosphatase PAP2 family protein [Actinomycetota bacterium]|jgi:undecaprenyl-diphosphatase